MLSDPTLTYEAGEKPLPERVVDAPLPPCPEPSSSLAIKIEDTSKTPVQILNELDPTAVFELIKEDCALLSHRYLAPISKLHMHDLTLCIQHAQ